MFEQRGQTLLGAEGGFGHDALCLGQERQGLLFPREGEHFGHVVEGETVLEALCQGDEPLDAEFVDEGVKESGGEVEAFAVEGEDRDIVAEEETTLEVEGGLDVFVADVLETDLTEEPL